MTPAEKAAKVKKAHACKPIGRQNPRKYPWICLVRARRQELRLSMRDVAENIGMSVAGIFEIERGSEPTLDTCRRLADFFGEAIESLWPARRKAEANGQ